MPNIDRAQPFGEEWNLAYVRDRLKNLSEVTQDETAAPLPDAYEKAAAVLEYFDPIHLRAIPDEVATNKDQVLNNSSVVFDAHGQPRSMLRSERRRLALQSLGVDGIRQAFSLNPRPDTTLQNMLEAYAFENAPNLQEQGFPQLAATLQVAAWFADLVPGVPDTTSVQQRVERESLLRPFRELAGTGFVGRQKEWGILLDYVGFLQPQSIFSQAAKGVRRLLSWHEKPPLVIYGPGGMGKSALIANFVLEHLEPVDYSPAPLPFVYLDFDRASLVPELPMTLLLEAGKQLAMQFSQIATNWEPLRQQWSSDMQRKTSVLLRDPRALQDFRHLLESGNLLRRPMLFVLDTFEEVQYRSRDFVDEVFDLLSLLQEVVPQLRVIVVGRAIVSVDKYRTTNYLLPPLGAVDASNFLQTHGLTAEIADQIAGQVGGSPLSLRLALGVVEKEGVDARGIAWLKTRNKLYMRLQDSQIQGQLYRRILGHIHSESDPRVAKLAHPGLVLRRVTPELIQYVLAEPCGLGHLDTESARELFEKLRREVALVTVAEDGSLRHLPELRRAMIELIRKDEPVKVKQILELAIAYHESKTDMPSRADALYYMLVLGRPRPELEAGWEAGMETFLAGSLQELPPKSRAWLAPRLGVDVDQGALQSGDLEDWEDYAFQRVRNVLQVGKPDVAMDLLAEREDRTFGSCLYVPQAEAQVLTHDLEGAQVTVTAGLRELQDPESILKLLVISSWIDLLRLESIDADDAILELKRTAERYPDDARTLRFGLNRLELVVKQEGNGRAASQIQELLGTIVAGTPTYELSLYPQLGRDLAVALGENRPELLVHLVEVFGVEYNTSLGGERLLEALQSWDEQTNALTRYNVRLSSSSPESLVQNLGLIANREGLSPDIQFALIEYFREHAQERSDQILYEELEVQDRMRAQPRKFRRK